MDRRTTPSCRFLCSPHTAESCRTASRSRSPPVVAAIVRNRVSRRWVLLRIGLVVILDIEHERRADLPSVGQAGDCACLLSRLDEDGKQNRRENRDDGDDDEQLYQGEGAARIGVRRDETKHEVLP